MTTPSRLSSFAWVSLLVLALVLIAFLARQQAARIDSLSAIGNVPVKVDPQSPTGYAHNLRRLVLPSHDNDSYQWIMQTQEMRRAGQWRLRHVDYDNAPTGRDVRSPSPYRWWLAAVAWVNRLFTGEPAGIAIERAALWADPYVLGFSLVVLTALTAFRLGAWPAGVLAVALTVCFPLSSVFQGGSPDDLGLALLLGLASLLLLLGGILKSEGAPAAQTRRSFLAAGVVAGLALWVNVGHTLPLLAGVALGGFALPLVTRSTGSATALPWRAWGIAGAITTVLAWLIEYAPSHLALGAWRLSEVHPLHAVAWLGLGEILARITAARARGANGLPADLRSRLAWGGAALAVLALPAAFYFKADVSLLRDTYDSSLNGSADGITANNLAAWIMSGGFSLSLLATVLPLGLAIVAAIWGWRNFGSARRALVVALGPLLVGFGFACSQLSAWNYVDVAVIALLVVAAAGASQLPRVRRAWAVAALVLLLLPGALLLFRQRAARSGELDRPQLEALVERDVAYWLARRAGPSGAIVLAPPNLAASAYYHGGLRGLGSPYRENADGFRASVRIAGSAAMDETQALARQRQLTHIIVPSWDNFLDEYARLGSGSVERSLMGLLHQWLPPRWLRPVPYYLPQVAGFETERVIVFEAADLQDNAASLSRLTEYFLEMGQLELATMASKALEQHFATDLGGHIARARTFAARREPGALRRELDAIQAGLKDGGSEALAWDQRVSLSIAFAEGGRIDAAKQQAQQSLAEMSEYDLRGLSNLTLYRFLTLCRALGLSLRNEELRGVARELLPERAAELP